MRGSSSTKLGICRVCHTSWNFGPDYEHYDTVNERFTLCCDRCLSNPKLVCVACRTPTGDDQLLICDRCDTLGAKCLSCAKLGAMPEGLWFCSERCERANKKRARSEFILPYCSITGDSKRAQYWGHCLDCDMDICIACMTCCHAGHALTEDGAFTYSAMVCDCGRQESCSNLVFRKAARLDAMMVAKDRATDLQKRREHLLREEQQLQAQTLQLPKELEQHKQAIAVADEAVRVSLQHESVLRETLAQEARNGIDTTVLCESVARIVDTVSARKKEQTALAQLVAEQAALLEMQRSLLDRCERLDADIVTLNAVAAAHSQEAKKLIDFDSLYSMKKVLAPPPGAAPSEAQLLASTKNGRISRSHTLQP